MDMKTGVIFGCLDGVGGVRLVIMERGAPSGTERGRELFFDRGARKGT